MLAAQLLNYADDFGYFNANPHLIQAECSPLRAPSVSVPESLRSLQTVGYLRLGHTPEGKRYGHIVKFLDHQRVSHPTESKIKELPIIWEDSTKAHGRLTEECVPELKGIEGNRIEQPPAAAGMVGRTPVSEKPKGHEYPPDFEQFWKAYCAPKNSSKSEAFKAWTKAKALLPNMVDHLAAVAAYRAWLDAESSRRGSQYPMKHAETWISERMWESYAVEPAQDYEELKRLWGGAAFALVEIIGPVAFHNVFREVQYEEGPPAHFRVRQPFMRDIIAQKYSKDLRKAYGEFILEIAA